MSTHNMSTQYTETDAGAGRLNVVQAAKLLGIDRATVYRLCQQRKIRHMRVGSNGGRIVFEAKDIEDYLASCVIEVGEPQNLELSRFKHLRLKGRGVG
jgi:excisionase family DNA binding protein